MSTCQSLRDLFSLSLDGTLTPEDEARLQDHFAECPECRELYDGMGDILTTVGGLAEVEPPPRLAVEISSSPCRRWLGLLFSAVDREISEANLDRLFQHLEKS